VKKGEILEGIIERVEFPNKGIVKTDEGTVIVKNGIPGQKIRFMINKKRKNKAEGRLLETLEKSPLETRKPVCSIFPACGGCMYQTMSYEAQLEMKGAQVKSLLDEALTAGGQVKEDGTPDYVFEGVKGSPTEFCYRNKIEFSFGDEYKDGPLSLGLHKKIAAQNLQNVLAVNCIFVIPINMQIAAAVDGHITGTVNAGIRISGIGIHRRIRQEIL
jgi:tRNA/tmRNA/rRNA uracil-C5-methylase (TrmA/RlmC/RlmD family)